MVNLRQRLSGYEIGLAFGVLLLLMYLSYVQLFVVGPLAFGFDGAVINRIDLLGLVENGTVLQENDVIRSVNGIQVPQDDSTREVASILFSESSKSDQLQLGIERDGVVQEVTWLRASLTFASILRFLPSYHTFSFLVWLAGLMVVVFMRPKDVRWRLLAAFNFLTAIWMVTPEPALIAAAKLGNFPGLVTALCLPVYTHLFLEFPSPLHRKASRTVGMFFYGLAFVIGIIAWVTETGWADGGITLFSLLLAFSGSILLIVLRNLFRPHERTPLRLITVYTLVMMTVLIGIGVLAGISSRYDPLIAGFMLLPFYPYTFLFTIYGSQLAGMRFRTNRLIAVYLFVCLLAFFFSILLIAYELRGGTRNPLTATIVGVGVAGGALLASQYGRFRRLIETKLLGMPNVPTDLLTRYANLITTSPDRNDLVDVLLQFVLPALQVKQSVLLLTTGYDEPAVVYVEECDAFMVPDAEQVRTLQSYDERFRPKPLTTNQDGFDWVRLALTLRVEDKPIGIWLLGHRDPDDIYNYEEISRFRGLADQTAIALNNISKSESLHALFQADIDTREEERSRLVLELHDEILNGLAVLSMQVTDPTPQFDKAYDNLVTSLRNTINNLRPGMLQYGLWIALDELLNQINERDNATIRVSNHIKSSYVRYAPQMELHAFRILQQGIENALMHSKATTIELHGELRDDGVTLSVSDNGIGFSVDGPATLYKLLEHKHFGLVGMMERADLIKADLQIDSKLERGTTVTLRWQQPHSHDPMSLL